MLDYTAQTIVINGIHYITENGAVLLIFLAGIVGFFFGVYYQRITGD